MKKNNRAKRFFGYLMIVELSVCMASFVFAGTTERVSVSSAGVQGNNSSQHPSLSADGRYVVFESQATNLVPGQANTYAYNVFVHDRQTGVTEMVSVSSTGQQGNRWSGYSILSGDGRYVAFHSDSTNLVSGDTNGYYDVFVHDRQTGVTERVSLSSSGVQGNDSSYMPSLSADGRYVAFYSHANNLVPGDTNGGPYNWEDKKDIFVRDRLTGVTERVSVSSSGAQADRGSRYPSISADGRFAAFESLATNLVSGDTNGASDIFVHDRQTGITERVSVSGAGEQGNGGSYDPSISADGQHVAFYSAATNLVAGDTNGKLDLFVHDRQTGVTERVNVSSTGQEANCGSGYFCNNPFYFGLAKISADGRYVVFDSWATNLIEGDTTPSIADIFIHDRQTGVTEIVSVSSAGEQGNGNSYGAAISADGQHVAFSSWSSNLVPGDTAGKYDVFVRNH